MKIGFEDAIHGLQTRIRRQPAGRLPEPAAVAGHVPERAEGPCPTCGGSGREHRPARLHEILRRPAPPAADRASPRARSAGPAGARASVPKSDLISVRIPAGVDNGSKVRVPGKGNAGRNGGPPGDLFIVIEVAPHAALQAGGRQHLHQGADHRPRGDPGGQDRGADALGQDDHPHPAGDEVRPEVPDQGDRARRSPAGSRGDEFVEVYIVPPPFDNQRIREMMKELGTDLGPEPEGNDGDELT